MSRARKPTKFVLRVTDNLGNVDYLTITPDHVSLVSRTQIPLALSNIARKDAFMMELDLRDAKTAAEAAAVARTHVYRQYTVEVVS